MAPEGTFFRDDLFEIPQDGSQPYLKGYRCKQCGQLDFPKLSPCSNCWGEDFEMVPLSRKGKLYAFTEVAFGQPGIKTPYVFGYVDLPENIRVFAQIEGGADSLEWDGEVEVTAGTIRAGADGQEVVSYKFRKATK